MKRLIVGLAAVFALGAIAAVFMAPAAAPSAKKLANLAPAAKPFGLQCGLPGKDYLCTDIEAGKSTFAVPNGAYSGPYLGHDEPSALFYSNTPGSGNNATFNLTLPKQPPTQPVQSGIGATWDFQLHPAFWFGMAMCDSTSYPNYTSICNPDTDANIFEDANPASPHFISKHPGTAFMEMQFYPPGWAPFANAISCSAFQWCASLNIDSYSVVSATNAFSNFPCSAAIGTVEPAQFAYLTKGTSGLGANGPANPWDATLATYTPNPANNLFMNGGDKLTVQMNDTSAGFKITVHDATTGMDGAMVAGPANGFAHPTNGPGPCDVPYAFHPMYSTSSEQTRVIWAAHSYNLAYSDEIGHFQNCSPVAAVAVFPGYAACTGTETDGAGLPEASDGDDGACLNGAFWTLLVPISGCLGGNSGFDGQSYVASDWPGNANDANTPTPITFSSPWANGNKSQLYNRVAFETDLIALENSAAPYGGAPLTCSTHTAGPNCSNPPATDDTTSTSNVKYAFYPMFTTTFPSGSPGACAYQEGGPGNGRVLFNFGGSSTAEYGAPYPVIYPQDGTTTGIIHRFENYHATYPNFCLPGN